MGRRLALVVIALLALATPAGAQEAPASVRVDGEPCADGAGVTVVVDFRELGDDTVLVRCAPDAPADGFAALEQAGIPYRTAVAFPGFLCRIADRPDDDPCDTASPADAYWSYWLAPAGGEWCYSNKGAGNRTPPAGAVEGWSFALDRTSEDVLPPRLDAPGAAEGAAPLAADDCTTAVASTDGPTTSTEAGAVGRGPAVDVDEASDTGSPVGTIAGIGGIAAVAVAALVVARRRRRPTTGADRCRSGSDPHRHVGEGLTHSDMTHSDAAGPDPRSGSDDVSIWARPPDEER